MWLMDKKQLKVLEAMSDSEINTFDIPEIKNWGNAVVGKFYRLLKKPVTIQLDAGMFE